MIFNFSFNFKLNNCDMRNSETLWYMSALKPTWHSVYAGRRAVSYTVAEFKVDFQAWRLGHRETTTFAPGVDPRTRPQVIFHNVASKPLLGGRARFKGGRGTRWCQPGVWPARPACLGRPYFTVADVRYGGGVPGVRDVQQRASVLLATDAHSSDSRSLAETGLCSAVSHRLWNIRLYLLPNSACTLYAVPSQDEPLCRNGTRASVFYYFENGRVGISVSCLYSLRPESYIAASWYQL